MSVTRRDFLASTASALAVGAGAARVRAQAPPAAPPVPSFQDLRGGVGMFIGQGGTIGYLVNDAGALAVDSQFANTAPIVPGRAQAALARAASSILLNTHHHGDHTGGNQVFRGQRQAHRRATSTASSGTARPPPPAKNEGAAVVRRHHLHRPVAHRLRRRDDPGAATTAPATPAATRSFHFEKANVVHMGDLLFNRAHPNIDRPAGAVIANWILVLEKVARAHSADTIFIAGHAKDNAVQCAKADVLRFRDYLSACMDTARKAIAAGQSKDELQKMTALTGFEDNASPNARLTLGFVLGQCADELAEKK